MAEKMHFLVACLVDWNGEPSRMSVWCVALPLLCLADVHLVLPMSKLKAK